MRNDLSGAERVEHRAGGFLFLAEEDTDRAVAPESRVAPFAQGFFQFHAVVHPEDR